MSNQSGSSTPSDDRVIQTQDSARPYSGRARGANPGQFPNRGPAASDAIFAAEAQCALLAEQLRTTQHALADTTSRLHAVEQAAAANARPPQFPPGWIDSMRERDLLTQQLTDSRTAQAAAHANERADMCAHAVEQAAAANARPPQFPPGWIDSMRERDLLTQQLTDSRTAQAAAHANERADMRASHGLRRASSARPRPGALRAAAAPLQARSPPFAPRARPPTSPGSGTVAAVLPPSESSARPLRARSSLLAQTAGAARIITAFAAQPTPDRPWSCIRLTLPRGTGLGLRRASSARPRPGALNAAASP